MVAKSKKRSKKLHVAKKDRTCDQDFKENYLYIYEGLEKILYFLCGILFLTS